MKKLYLHTVVILFFASLSVNSQVILPGTESMNWFFGEKAGITFNTPNGEPIAISGEMTTEEGCAVVSDNSGNLLFYASGENIWNSEHRLMKGGFELKGGFSSTQAVLILQKPKYNDIFYVFNTENLGGDFFYSEVDLSANNGLGEVAKKNIYIASDIGEKLTAVRHANGDDIWVLVKSKTEHVFLAWLLTAEGLMYPPIKSYVPVNVDLSHKYSAMGYMKFSPDGTMIASASFAEGQVEIYDFNLYTGEVSNPIEIRIDNGFKTYGVSFSPDGKKLYVSYYDYDAYLVQYDISSRNYSEIVSSKRIIAEYHDGIAIGAIQAGPNGKLYVSRYRQNYLSSIELPNEQGALCQYVENAVELVGGRTRLGLPNFTYVSHYYHREPDLAYHNVQITIPSFEGSPGDTNKPIEVYAKLLNDSIKAENLSITFAIMFDATCFSPQADNPNVTNVRINNKLCYVKINLENVSLTDEDKLIAKIDGVILLPEKTKNEISILDAELSDTSLHVFKTNGYLIVFDVCRNNLRKVQVQSYEFTVSPNPIEDKTLLTFSTPVRGYYYLGILNAAGVEITRKRIFSEANGTVTTEIDMTDIAAGIYVATVRSAGLLMSKKLLKLN